MGISGIANGLAIEFDTFGEIASDHTNFRAATGGFATPRMALANIEDGAWHPVVVSWNAATQTMSYTFDGQSMGTLTGRIIRYPVPRWLKLAHVGFGAATGGLSNTQSVRNVTVTATLEGQTPASWPLKATQRQSLTITAVTTLPKAAQQLESYRPHVRPMALGANYGWPNAEGPCIAAMVGRVDRPRLHPSRRQVHVLADQPRKPACSASSTTGPNTAGDTKLEFRSYAAAAAQASS